MQVTERILACAFDVHARFDGIELPSAYRADLIVEQAVLLELKAVERLLSIHIAQTLTYIKHANLAVGLLLNFNVRSLRDGIRRVDNRFVIPELLS